MVELGTLLGAVGADVSGDEGEESAVTPRLDLDGPINRRLGLSETCFLLAPVPARPWRTRVWV